MTRLLTPLAAFVVVLVLVATALGLGLRLVDIRKPEDLDAQRWKTIHFLVGLAAGLAVVLANSVVVTYFIGTSRWCKEVVHVYALDPDLVTRSTRLKRRTFPFALAAMLAVVAIVALGGAADPAAWLQLPPPGGLTWKGWHLLSAVFGIVFVVLGFLVAGRNVRANHEVIGDVLAEVQRIRAERGLPA